MFSFGTQDRMKIFGAICLCNNEGWKMPFPILFQSFLFSRVSGRADPPCLPLGTHRALDLPGGKMKPLLRVGNFSTHKTHN